MHVLILGATGYVGGRLVPRLLEAGHTVRCMVRDPRKAAGKPWADRVDIVAGDVLRPETLDPAFAGIDIIYYLIHSMATGEGEFESLDRRAAQAVAAQAETSGVKRIVYLGGLGRRDEAQSPHLRSRHEVGDMLRTGTVPVTEFRAAVIVGSGSLSFELIHHLVNRLPLMICPRWVYTRTQPIAIADILRYLVSCLNRPGTAGKSIDLGGPEVLTYRDMMLTVARVLGLKRLLIQVPVLTPRLSSYWVNLVTPIQTQVARALIESLRHETVCENDLAATHFDIEPMDFESSVRRALARIREHNVETRWTGAASRMSEAGTIDPSHLRTDERTIEVQAAPQTVFRTVAAIGGDTGWYYGNWLWWLRGFIDQQFGGVGLRRGRRHPVEISVGDALDFWRVEEYIPGKKLLLRAEMKVWGQAWLEFAVQPIDQNLTRLTQTARYYPRGLIGLAYWYGVFPIHALVFQGMIRAMGQAAERAAAAGETSTAPMNEGKDNAANETN